LLNIEVISTRDEWNALLRPLPTAHVLQTWEWGDFKHATTGWQPERLRLMRGGETLALVLLGVRSIGPLKVIYAPKGPVFATDKIADRAAVIDELQRFARRRAALWLKIDPDIIVGTGIPGEADDTPDEHGISLIAQLRERGWRFSTDQVQFRNSVCIDLTQSEDTLLAAMSQNTRRKVRIAERESVTVRAGTLDDLPLLYDLYRITGERDAFLIRPFDYYQEAWRRFIAAGLAHPLIAEVGGQAVAHVILFHFGRKCWYFYGASSNEARDTMPNYLLQWEALRWAKAQGYTVYDMWGAPDTFVESDPLWGVYQFKRGFRGVVTRHVGAWDYAPYPLLYRAYTELMPHVRGWLRR
jgi:lipid II:glycine glycyltransferase (peptidoglycan interpeptide bridge formation enzyme)